MGLKERQAALQLQGRVHPKGVKFMYRNFKVRPERPTGYSGG